MKKEILITLLCASLMLVTPFTTAAQENKVTSNLKDEPDVEGLVAQITDVIDEILQKYGHNSMVRSLFNLILDLIWYPGKIIICVFLYIIFSFIGALWVYAWQVFNLSGKLLEVLMIHVFGLFIIAGCIPWPYKSLKSITNLKDIGDIINLVNDCPCLKNKNLDAETQHLF